MRKIGTRKTNKLSLFDNLQSHVVLAITCSECHLRETETTFYSMWVIEKLNNDGWIVDKYDRVLCPSCSSKLNKGKKKKK